jgi:hypothetical protein
MPPSHSGGLVDLRRRRRGDLAQEGRCVGCNLQGTFRTKEEETEFHGAPRTRAPLRRRNSDKTQEVRLCSDI